MKTTHRLLTKSVAVCAACVLVLSMHRARAAETPAADSPAENYRISFVSEASKDYDDAIRRVLTVKHLPTYRYTAQLRLGWLYYCINSYAASRNAYQNALKAHQTSVEARVAMLLPILAQGSFDEAEMIAKQVIEVDKLNYYANLRLAYALRMQKKFIPAEKIDVMMLEYFPSDVTFQTELGLAKLGQLQRDAAKKIFTDILAVDPDNVTAKAVLAGK